MAAARKKAEEEAHLENERHKQAEAKKAEQEAVERKKAEEKARLENKQRKQAEAKKAEEDAATHKKDEEELARLKNEQRKLDEAKKTKEETAARLKAEEEARAEADRRRIEENAITVKKFLQFDGSFEMFMCGAIGCPFGLCPECRNKSIVAEVSKTTVRGGTRRAGRKRKRYADEDAQPAQCEPAQSNVCLRDHLCGLTTRGRNYFTKTQMEKHGCNKCSKCGSFVP